LNVSFNISTDKVSYLSGEQVDIIIEAPLDTLLNISILRAGDSSPYDIFTTTITNSKTTFFRSFDSAGDYSVVASFDYHGFMEEQIDYFSVVTSDLSVAIEVDDSVVEVGEEIDFESFVSGNQGTVSYSWDFNNDGVSDSSDENPDHTFENDGSFTVNLTVEDDLSSASVTRVISVREEFLFNITVVDNRTSDPIKNVTAEFDDEIHYTDDKGYTEFRMVITHIMMILS